MKKIAMLLAAFLISASECSAAPAGLGMTLPIFMTQMGIAFDQVRWGFSSEALSEAMITTPEGNYAAEYSDEIILCVNMVPGTNRIQNIAISFMVTDQRGASGRYDKDGGEAHYESLCEQILLAIDHSTTEKEAQDILTELGIFGPVLDGHQRCVRNGKYLYMMRFYQSNIMLLVLPAL